MCWGGGGEKRTRKPRLFPPTKSARVAEELGDNDGDEVRFPARQRPQVVDHGLWPPEVGVEDVEVGMDVRERAEARPDAGIAARARRVDRAEVVAGDLPRVPERFPQSGVG